MLCTITPSSIRSMASLLPANVASAEPVPLTRKRWWEAKPMDAAARKKRVERIFRWSLPTCLFCLVVVAVATYYAGEPITVSSRLFLFGLLITRLFLNDLRSGGSKQIAWSCIAFGVGLPMLMPAVGCPPHTSFARAAGDGLLLGGYRSACAIAGVTFLLTLFHQPFLRFLETTDESLPSD